MPIWRPDNKWEGEDVFIIGGGDSLRNFDWSLLKDERTIGCNDAFLLGEETCKICMFGDAPWFRRHKTELAKFKGIVFTNATQLYRTQLSWLWTTQRESKGLSKRSIAWNDNTGAAAVNLALLLGAKRIFLLGFDMHSSKEGNTNWHSKSKNKIKKDVYVKFLIGFTQLNIALKKKFPGREIINVTDDSDLDLFPKIACEKFWVERKKNV